MTSKKASRVALRDAAANAPQQPSHSRLSGVPFGAGGTVGRFLGSEGTVDIDHLVLRFGMSKRELANIVGLRAENLQRAKRAMAPRTQRRLMEMLEVVGRIAGWAGGERQALAWYLSEPIPAFGDRTAEYLVKDGKAAALRDYLDHIALGGFA